MDRQRPAPAHAGGAKLCALSASECRGLLADAGTAQVAVVAPDGPHIIPVTFTLVDEAIVFRTDPATLLGRYADGATLAVEVGATDPVHRTGWSVVVRGPAELSGRRVGAQPRSDPWF